MEERRHAARPRSDPELLDALPMGVLVLDAAGTILRVNPVAQEVLGHPTDQLRGRSFLDSLFAAVDEDGTPIPPGQRPLVRALSSGAPLRDVVVGMRRPDGERVWLLEAVCPRRDEAGAVEQVIVTFMDITARKRAEEALQESAQVLQRSESRWLSLIDAAPIGIFTWDEQFRFTALNDAYCALTGYTRQELLRAEPLQVCLPEQRAALVPEFRQRFRGDAAAQGEYTLLTKGGERRTVLGSGTTIVGLDGRPERLTFVLDITAPQQAEEALRASELRLRAVIGSAPVALYAFDLQGRYTLDEGRLLERVHRAPGSLLGQSIYERHRGRPQTLAAFERARAGERVTFVAPNHDGSVVAEHHMAPLRDPQGQIVGVIGVATDVTERMRAEEALRRSEQSWRTLIEATPIGISMVDAQYRFAAVNDALCSMSGYARDELLGRGVSQVFPPEQSTALQAEHHRRFVQNVREPLEYTLLTKGGERRTVLTSGVTVSGPEGQPRRLSFAIDITARRQAEEALRRANADLAQANADLERASAAKSAFLATMSHEIRTPLNGVIGLSSLLRLTPLNPTQREYVEALQVSGETLLSLINDILDLSKIEADGLALEVGPLDVRQVVEEVVTVFAAQARAKGLALGAQVDAAVPSALEGDAGRLRQVLLNLVGNAVKFTDHGAVQVAVALLEKSADGTLLRIGVRDTGIGIAAAVQAQLFAPFMQADGSTTRRYGGTGLGLAIAKRLVQAMGGQIGVQSAPGEGSTFWLTLRLVLRETASDHGRPAASRMGPPVPGRARGRVLVAEDNPINRLVVVRLLESLGYAVEAVEDGRQAVEAAGRERYDLVLMDLHMPELDGFAATAAIRRREAAGKGRHLPIVALTADALAGDVEKSLAEGMDDYLSKPLSPERLAAMLERWVTPPAK
jgi:PAS domain S-box-containing protein